jgi:hypothetical protein
VACSQLLFNVCRNLGAPGDIVHLHRTGRSLYGTGDALCIKRHFAAITLNHYRCHLPSMKLHVVIFTKCNRYIWCLRWV